MRQCKVVFLDGTYHNFEGFTDAIFEGSVAFLAHHTTLTNLRDRSVPVHVQRNIVATINLTAIKYLELSGETP